MKENKSYVFFDLGSGKLTPEQETAVREEFGVIEELGGFDAKSIETVGSDVKDVWGLAKKVSGLMWKKVIELNKQGIVPVFHLSEIMPAFMFALTVAFVGRFHNDCKHVEALVVFSHMENGKFKRFIEFELHRS